jgi:hypothetical protein
MTHFFVSKFRTLDFAVGTRSYSFREFQFSTDDEDVASTLRSMKDVTDVTAAKGASAPAAEVPKEEVAKAQEALTAVAEGAPKAVAGMRTSTTKDKKEKTSK